MAVKVLITRTFKQERLQQAYQLLMELRSSATLKKGYISGQTLISADNPNKLVVVSTWSGRKSWDAWQADEKRKEHAKTMGELLEAPEQIEVFFAGVQDSD
ncbi:MAG: antibiotic biosynthesis monooxygenase [Deltaproteobacteria bacterium]